MDAGQIHMLVQFFKTLADEKRLHIIGLLTDREMRVAELAEALELSEPTISHHLKILREMGLVNLRIDGTSHYYRLSTDMMKRLKRQVDQLESLEVPVQRTERDDLEWIEALDFGEDDKKVLRDYTAEGRLTQIPVKQKKLLVILNWLDTLFEESRFYTEAEVNEIIGAVHHDYVTLRRCMIDFGYLRRERGGGQYWKSPVAESFT